MLFMPLLSALPGVGSRGRKATRTPPRTPESEAPAPRPGAPVPAPDPERERRIRALIARLRREAAQAEDISEMYELLERIRGLERSLEA